MDGIERLFFRWLHMLDGRTTFASKSDAGRLTYRDIYDGSIEINGHLLGRGDHAIMTGPPSFLIGADPEIGRMAKHLLTISPAAKSDWGRELAYVRTFGADFFGRAGCEVREAYDSEIARRPAGGGDVPEGLRWT